MKKVILLSLLIACSFSFKSTDSNRFSQGTGKLYFYCYFFHETPSPKASGKRVFQYTKIFNVKKPTPYSQQQVLTNRITQDWERYAKQNGFKNPDNMTVDVYEDYGKALDAQGDQKSSFDLATWFVLQDEKFKPGQYIAN